MINGINDDKPSPQARLYAVGVPLRLGHDLEMLCGGAYWNIDMLRNKITELAHSVPPKDLCADKMVEWLVDRMTELNAKPKLDDTKIRVDIVQYGERIIATPYTTCRKLEYVNLDELIKAVETSEDFDDFEMHVATYLWKQLDGQPVETRNQIDSFAVPLRESWDDATILHEGMEAVKKAFIKERPELYEKYYFGHRDPDDRENNE